MTGPSYKNASVCSMILDGPQRYQWQDPDKIIATLITSPDLSVADLGAGTGFFTSLLSKALPEGKVAALEPEAALVEWLKKRKAEEGLSNVDVFAIGHDKPSLELIDGDIDLLFVGYTYFHFDDPVPYFREKVGPLIQNTTKIAIADVEPEFAGAMRKKVSSAQVIEEMKEAGFKLEAAPGLAENQYLLIFRKDG
ncbi:MAG: methyltransferase domain-containing protein [Proteobacteria bacterium]|nr:methyltransferase domain-containing protein [Pseudomonadota bacterium]